jgi:hypothetical protein
MIPLLRCVSFLTKCARSRQGVRSSGDFTDHRIDFLSYFVSIELSARDLIPLAGSVCDLVHARWVTFLPIPIVAPYLWRVGGIMPNAFRFQVTEEEA